MPGKKPEIARQLLKISTMISHLFRHADGLVRGTGSGAQYGTQQQQDHPSFVHDEWWLGGKLLGINAAKYQRIVIN